MHILPAININPTATATATATATLPIVDVKNKIDKPVTYIPPGMNSEDFPVGIKVIAEENMNFLDSLLATKQTPSYSIDDEMFQCLLKEVMTGGYKSIAEWSAWNDLSDDQKQEVFNKDNEYEFMKNRAKMKKTEEMKAKLSSLPTFILCENKGVTMMQAGVKWTDHNGIEHQEAVMCPSLGSALLTAPKNVKNFSSWEKIGLNGNIVTTYHEVSSFAITKGSQFTSINTPDTQIKLEQQLDRICLALENSFNYEGITKLADFVISSGLTNEGDYQLQKKYLDIKKQAKANMEDVTRLASMKKNQWKERTLIIFKQ